MPSHHTVDPLPAQAKPSPEAQRGCLDSPVLTQAERHQLLVECNSTHAPYPEQMCVHQLFEARAARTPNATAVLRPSEPPHIETSTLTYQELNGSMAHGV